MKPNGKIVSVIVGAVVLVAAAVAVATGGSDSSPGTTVASTSAGSTGTDSSSNSLPATVPAAEYQPVRVVGDVLAPMPESGTDTGIGATVPVVNGYDFAGEAVSLDVAASGRPTMVVFLAHWCPHCNREIPRILEWAGTSGVPDGLRIVGVATSSRNDYPNWPPSEWLVNMGWKWDTMADSRDGSAFAAYGGTSFPTMVLVGPDGTVRNRFSGEIEVSDLDRLVREFVASVTKA
jgi:cytochrome c biogenesis protein CcmG/thiol:disulfide interchange protein DsbE